MISKIEFRTELNSTLMKKKDGPCDLFEKIAVCVKSRYNRGNSVIEDDKLMSVVIEAAPIEYRGSLLNGQRNKGNKVRFDDLCGWQLYGSRFISQVEGGSEVPLTTFVGKCFTCKKKGNNASTCPKKGIMKNENEMSAESYGRCGKKGHNGAHCWLKPEYIDEASD
jgi:hypothetical protein